MRRRKIANTIYWDFATTYSYSDYDDFPTENRDMISSSTAMMNQPLLFTWEEDYTIVQKNSHVYRSNCLTKKRKDVIIK